MIKINFFLSGENKWSLLYKSMIDPGFAVASETPIHNWTFLSRKRRENEKLGKGTRFAVPSPIRHCKGHKSMCFEQFIVLLQPVFFPYFSKTISCKANFCFWISNFLKCVEVVVCNFSKYHFPCIVE